LPRRTLCGQTNCGVSRRPLATALCRENALEPQWDIQVARVGLTPLAPTISNRCRELLRNSCRERVSAAHRSPMDLLGPPADGQLASAKSLNCDRDSRRGAPDGLRGQLRRRPRRRRVSGPLGSSSRMSGWNLHSATRSSWRRQRPLVTGFSTASRTTPPGRSFPHRAVVAPAPAPAGHIGDGDNVALTLKKITSA
jgi:hypothetical protein